MKILFCHHGSICEPGIIRGFKSLGYEIVFPEQEAQNPETDRNYMEHLWRQAEREKADILFSVNFVPVISKACEAKRIPYFCWIVDSPVIQLYSDTLKNSCNYVFIFDKTLYQEFYMRNPAHIFYLPLGCDVEWFDGIKVTPEEETVYASEISFVGSLYSEKCLYNAIESRLPEYLRGFFDAVMQAQCKIYGYNFLSEVLTEEIVEWLSRYVSIEQEREYAIDQRILFGNMLLNPKCTELERTGLLNSLAECFRVDFYTQSDVSKLRNVNCRGSVSSLEGMPRVFKSSKINLNLTAKGIQSGASLRIFDVLGCGGFLISNYQAELPELFEPGKELVLFESEQDLKEKCAYYLEHEEERKEIARNGYEKVKSAYSYKKRLQCMMEIYSEISGVYGD